MLLSPWRLVSPDVRARVALGNLEDMVSGDVIFCATGVTDGDLVKGIKDLGNSFEAETFVLHKSSN